MQISTILVPMDGSALAEAALPPAIGLAREHGARMVLLRAVEAHTRPMGDPVQAQVDAVSEAERYIGGMRERVREAGVAGVDVSVWYGPPAESIVEGARYRQADLIVMSSHGRTGLGRLVLGSVAERVLRGTRVPILLIRPGDVPTDAPATPSTAKEIAHV